MKRTAMQHTKLIRLMRAMQVPKYAAVGILESLWHLTAREAPAGNIGKLTDEDIAAWIDWQGDASLLVVALVSSGWLNVCEKSRLIVHDWHEHADDATDNHVARSVQLYSNGSKPRMTRLSKVEREHLAERYATASTSVRTEAHEMPLPLPLPEPEPEPEPEKKELARTSPSPITLIAEVPTKHKQFHQAVDEHWGQCVIAGEPAPWNGREGTALKQLLETCPWLTVERFKVMLANRAASGVTLSDRPALWLANATSYMNGPINGFRNPLATRSNGEARVGIAREDSTTERSRKEDEELRARVMSRDRTTKPVKQHDNHRDAA